MSDQITIISFAQAESRTYITPEDVVDAKLAGMPKLALYEELLMHIERRNVEDVTLCCYVALEVQVPPTKATR